MRKFKLDKLVRDGVFDNMQALGEVIDYKILTGPAFIEALHNKLFEEIKEFDPTSEKPLTELADVLETIEALAKALGSDFEQLRKIQATKRSKRGGFGKRIFVKTVALNDDDPWVEYYASHPDRFPEL